MKKYATVFFLISVFLLLAYQNACAHDKDLEKNHPSNIESWRFVLNGSFEVYHPYYAAKADNNWEIILACLHGKTREELEDKGISFTESQLLLLRGMQFITEENEILKTVLPILGEAQMYSIREAARDLAIKLESKLKNDVDILREELRKAGHESSIFTLLFSIGLDNVPFYYAIQEKLVSEEKLSAERYLWGGQFYAYYPPRELRCGTNSYGEDGLYICLNWSDKPWDMIKKYFNSKNLNALSREYRENGKITDEDLISLFAKTGICLEDGNLTVPILKKNSVLYDTCYHIRDKAGQLFVDNIDFKGLMEKCNLYDEVVAMTVFYHEWEWEFMGLLEERGLMKRPFVFTNPEEAGPKDIGTLLFVVDSRNNQ